MRRTLYLLAALWAAATAWAQEVPEATLDTLVTIDEVVVWGIRPFSEVIPAQRLSGVQLEALGSHNVADAIRYFAGIQLKDYGGVGGIKTVDMRSMGVQALRMLRCLLN